MKAVVFAMEPMLVPESDVTLEDLTFDLVQTASSLAAALKPEVRREIGRLVRSMNCYYSNFLEGHQTHPRDIERALASDYSTDPAKRSLQAEARAHIEVQTAIDLDVEAPKDWPASQAYVRWVHHEFCRRLPEDMLVARTVDTKRLVRILPGEFRTDTVEVGQHTPPPPELLPAFMARFTEAYRSDRLSKTQKLLCAATAHHRLAWIHPFADGNGRVARLMSHAILFRLGIGSSLWSVSRGLARQPEQYKALLAAADRPRSNDLDGRGALSLEALKDFCRFFLGVCIDQVAFMHNLLQPGEILRRVELYVNDEIAAKRLPKGSFEMLREAFYEGSVPRGRAPQITGYEERRARDTLSALLERGLLVASSPRGPVSLGIPMDVVERWLPTLYPVDAPMVSTSSR
jgi:Fic family protein